jgi:hypothetical protein
LALETFTRQVEWIERLVIRYRNYRQSVLEPSALSYQLMCEQLTRIQDKP